VVAIWLGQNFAIWLGQNVAIWLRQKCGSGGDHWPRSDSDIMIFIFFPFHQLRIFFSKMTNFNFGWDRSAEAVVESDTSIKINSDNSIKIK